MPTAAGLIKRRYRTLLCHSLRSGRRSALTAARRLGSQAAAAGLSVFELAALHEQTLVDTILPAAKPARWDHVLRAASALFTTVAATRDTSGRGPLARIRTLLGSLGRRAVRLATVNAALVVEITRRKAAESSLARSKERQREMLTRSARLQHRLRRLSRLLLNAQEEERRVISRELHDVIGQTLAGINIRLATLKREARLNYTGLDRHIAQAQRMVLRSVDIVHRFARELRPAILDDLGLLPALQAHMKVISHKAGLRIRMQVCTAVEQLSLAHRTVLFRVAQEALTNVVRHARATTVDLSILRVGQGLRMVIHDNGRSFRIQPVLEAQRGKRLGLLGMRERIEMANGTLAIASTPGSGTTITATIPYFDERKATRPAATR